MVRRLVSWLYHLHVPVPAVRSDVGQRKSNPPARRNHAYCPCCPLSRLGLILYNHHEKIKPMSYVISIFVIVLFVLGAVFAVIRQVIPSQPQPNHGTNNISFGPWVQYESYPYPYWPTQYLGLYSGSRTETQGMAQYVKTFSFQYGFNSTNGTNPVWSKTGTNLTITMFWPNDDPAGSNNPNWQLTNKIYNFQSIIDTPINTSNCYDVIYQNSGWLYHLRGTNVNGTYVTAFDNNLTLVVSSSPDMVTWSPVFTNAAVGLDIPYTFSDSQATIPNKFYRVTAQ